MALGNAKKFAALLREDEALRNKVYEAVNAADVADEKALFEVVVAPLAAEMDLPFTYEEGAELLATREIDEAELAAVAGGDWGFCIIIGISDHPDATCREPGYACAGIGVGAGGEIND